MKYNRYNETNSVSSVNSSGSCVYTLTKKGGDSWESKMKKGWNYVLKKMQDNLQHIYLCKSFL